MTSPKILIVGYPLFRRGIKALIEGIPFADINESETLKGIDGKTNIVIMHLYSSLNDDFNAITNLNKRFPGIITLAISCFENSSYAYRAFKSGVTGYVEKSAGEDEILKAFQMVSNGKRYMPESLMVDFIDNGHQEQLFTDREMQVISGLSIGKTLTEIGDHLSIGLKGVYSHFTTARKKLGLKTEAQLMLYGIKNGY